MSGLVNVGEIPYTDVELSGITAGAGKLRTVASAVRDGTADIHSAWTPISQSYEGPGDQALYDAMTPIVPQGTSFGDDLDSVAKALDDFVTEVTPIVAKLKTYVTRGNTLHADVAKHDGAWDEDETLNGENNDIINGVANQVVAYQAAERTCANTIRALNCLAPLHSMSGDGTDDPLGYGYDELPMGTQLPWGTAEARKESCGEKTLYFVPNLVKGVVVDGIWGTVQGLGQLVGIDGTGWHLDTLTNAWKGMGSLIGYSAADDSWSWGNAGDAWKGLGKATVGWDEWAKDPGTAAGQAIWGIGSLLIPVAGEVGKVGALGKVGEVAGTVGKAGRVLDLVDAGAWASKGLTAVLPKLGDLKGVVAAGLGDTLSGFSGKIADFRAGLGDFTHGHHGGEADVPPARAETGVDTNTNTNTNVDTSTNADAGSDVRVQDGGSSVDVPPVREPELVGAGGHGGHGESGTTTHGGGSDSGSTGGTGHGGSGIDHGGSGGGSGHGTDAEHGGSGHGTDGGHGAGGEHGSSDADGQPAGTPGTEPGQAPGSGHDPDSGQAPGSGDHSGSGGDGNPPHVTPDWMPEVTSGVRFFGSEQLQYFERANATLGRPGDAMFMMPEADAAKVTDSLSASIESGMAPSAMKAWQTGGDVFGVVVPIDGLAARLPTLADAGGWEHFVPGGHTAIKVGNEFFINETREFVVDGGIPMPPGSVVFKLIDGGHWEPILIYG